MILVTGAAGFSGSRIVSLLAKEGVATRGLVRNPDKAKGRLPEQGVEVVAGDTTQPETLEAAVNGVETIIHTAFITAERKQGPGVNYYDTNVLGTANLVTAAQKAGVRRIVVLSGLGTKPDKPGTYMQGRYLAQQAVKQSGLAWSILGPSIQFGKGSAFFNGLADLIRGTPLIVPMIGNGKRQFQPIWVEDVARCIVLMAREPEAYDGRTIDIGGPDYYTYAQILDMLMQTLHKRRIKVPGPMPFVKLGAGLMEAVMSKPPITRAATGLFTFENTAELDAVEKYFHFQPMSLRAYLDTWGVS
ncbi:MAG: SDR family oxidoreductase [Nitrososphaerota archaeon]